MATTLWKGKYLGGDLLIWACLDTVTQELDHIHFCLDTPDDMTLEGQMNLNPDKTIKRNVDDLLEQVEQTYTALTMNARDKGLADGTLRLQ